MTLTDAGQLRAAGPPEGVGSPVRLSLLLSGVYAWVTTVAGPAFSTPGFNHTLSAVGAAVALIAGLVLASTSPRLGRAVTMGGFLGLSALTWVLLGPQLSPAQLEPVRAAFGGLGWMLFAFGWGVVRKQDAIPENDPRVIAAKPLSPRRSVAAGTYVVFGAAVALALCPWFLAWRLVRSEHALLAQAASLLCAIAMVAAGAQVATLRGQEWIRPQPSERLNLASPALAALVILGMIGVVVWFVRGV